MIELSLEKASEALEGLTIPPRPSILVDLYTRLQKKDPDPKAIAARLAKDVVLSAAVLKTVNSARYGLRAKSASVSHAVQLLGVRNVATIVTGVLLRNSVGGQKLRLEGFWDSAEKVALISGKLADALPAVPREDAYLFGLFRDVGIPLLMQRWPAYKDTLSLAARQERPLPSVEDERHGTNHAVLGYVFSKTWGIPTHLSEGILHHHDLGAFGRRGVSRETLALVAINHLAEQIHDSEHRSEVDPAWSRTRPAMLSCLGLTEGELDDLSEDLRALAG
jgi:HD-like signal output (HDOD) protein